MEWYLALLVILGLLILLMASGMPVAFCFLVVSILGAFLWWGGEIGIKHLTLSITSSVSSFIFLPIPLFILMGEAIFHSGVAPRIMDTVDKWMGRLPGRLGLLAVSAGTLFSVLTGSSMASTAMLGATLVPEMERRNYKKPMSLGPILGSGGLAIMIPPSALAVLVAAIGNVSVARTLVAIVVPGLVMAILYASYIIIRCWLQPSIAPPYKVSPSSVREKLIDTVKYVLPVGVVVFAVLGVILLGIATPTEAAATGALSCYILAAANGQLNWQMIKKSAVGTLQITVMIFMIIVGTITFTQILAFSGASQGLLQYSLSLPVPPLMLIMIMQVVVLLLGCFMDPGAILMVTIPIFMPVIRGLGFDPVWFMVLLLLNAEMATTTPPYGLGLFIMKGVAPPDTTMGDCYRAALPFLYCDAIVMALLIAFPSIALWLPSLIK